MDIFTKLNIYRNAIRHINCKGQTTRLSLNPFLVHT